MTTLRPGACSPCEDCRLCEAKHQEKDEDRIRTVVRDTVLRVLDLQTSGQPGFELKVGVSARHIHITEDDLAVLYGEGHRLTVMRDLTGPGEFAAQETITLVGPNMRALQGVRILGPCRSRTQVELAPTDGVFLGLALPMRASGDVTGSAPITLIGPGGPLYLKEGAIRADRHIHISPEDAGKYRVRDGQRIRVDAPGAAGLTFNHVRIRVSPGFAEPVMHIDTDDGNAAALRCGDPVRAVI
jgi:propanediol utilization protein